MNQSHHYVHLIFLLLLCFTLESFFFMYLYNEEKTVCQRVLTPITCFIICCLCILFLFLFCLLI